MPSKSRKRWPPSLSDVKKVVAIVAAEVTTGSVTDIFHAVRRRCPEWAVTPHRVRKALAALQHSKKRGGKKSSSSSGSSSDNHTRVYPHDVVELKPHAARARHAPWQWRGQVLRVAGYDDGETTDDEDQELPAGHCSVFWLGHGLEQWPNALTKESSVRVVDRPWVLGDRVAKADDPRSLGTVVGVTCRLRFSAIPGPTPPSPEVSVQAVRAVGGFRAEDWVASEATRWVGKVEEAVFRVEVELCSRPDQRMRGKGRHKPPVCVFQVSSEGLQGLEPAGGEDVTPQELSPHFPGQRVKAPARLWRQAEWIRGSLGRRSPRRGVSICGVVTSVECCLLAVRWLAGVVKDSHPPDEWVSPEALRPLLVPNSSEGWAIGDHVQASPDSSYASAVIVESRTVVDVRWADGKVEENVSSVKLCPRPHISAHDFLPLDFVARSSEGFAEPAAQQPQVGTQTTRMDTENMNNHNQESLYSEANCTTNSENIMYGYAPEGEEMDNNSEIVSTDGFVTPQVDTPLGVVTNVNLQARTAEVQWVAGTAGEAEEVSVFELTDHPQVDVRLGDAVLIPIAQDRQWAGRVCGLRADGCARVELLDGTSRWHDVRNLIVIDDGEGAESMDDGMGSEGEGGSTRSDGALSEVSEGRERDGESELSDLEWQDPTYLYASAFVVALDVASALSLVDECEGENASIPLVRPLSEGNRVKWWLGLSHSDSNRSTTPSNVLAHIFPVAWLHVPKSGTSLFNAIIHIPGACPSVPEDFAATIHGLHTALLMSAFEDMFGELPHSCPGAFNRNWSGGHRGIANNILFDTQFKGHGLIMLRQPEQRIISAWHDTQHSWPYPQKPFARNISEFAEGIQGCATKMLTRGGRSYFMDTRSFHVTYGPHWGGPCGDPMKPSAGEVTLAKARLRDFVFLGITDQWQMSMCLFHAIMGTHCHSADFADSQTKDEMDHPDYNAEARLGNFHDAYDGELFEYAVALFTQKLAEYGLSPSSCKPCFDEAGVMFTNS